MSTTQFVQLVENTLGWRVPQHRGPAWKKYHATVKQVEALQKVNPDLYTLENLTLAVALLKKERRGATPCGVFYHVERAIALSADKEMDLEIDIRKAVSIEAERGDPDNWVERFSRSIGPYRVDTYNEWREVNWHVS